MTSKTRAHLRGPLLIAVAYGVVSFLWVTGSDLMLDALIADGRWRMIVAMGKGYAFVSLTAVLLFFAAAYLQRRVAQLEHHSNARLAESERAYRELFENNPNPMWVVEQATQRFLAANRMAERNYGYTRDEFAALTLSDLVDADSLPDLPRLLHRDRAATRVRRGIARHRTRDGRALHVEVASYQTTFDGQAACMLIAHDISRRVEMENDLRASKNLLRFAHQLAGVGTLVCDIENGEITWSEQALALFGFAPDEPGPDMHQLMAMVHPDDRELAEQRLALHRSGITEATTTELRLCLPTINPLYLLVRTRRRYWQQDDHVRVVMAMLDVTERKQIEQRLAGSEQHYRQLVDLLPDALFVLQGGRIVFANPAAARMFRAAAPEELLDRNIFELVVDARDSGLLQRVAQQRSGVQTACDWHRFRRLDGNVFEGSGAMTARVGDEMPTLQLVVRDLSELRRVEAQLAQANSRLQRVSSQLIRTDEAVRRRLASELHDDVGQLLTFITMTSSALRKKLEGSEPEGRAVALHAAAREALAKVRDLTLMLRPALLDAGGLEAALRSHLERFLEGSGVAFDLHCDCFDERPDPETEIALFRIAQEAITNVLRHAQATRIDVRLSGCEGGIELRLIDDGDGFDVERKLNEAATAGVFGMHERAQLLGGSFEIRSTPGVGTELRARLPLHTPAAATETEG